MVGIEDIVLKQQGGISLHFSNHRIMRRNRTYSHNWVVVKEEDNKQDNLRFGFWNPVDFMSCSNGDVDSRSSVRFWITLVVGGARHTDLASDPKTRIQQS